MKDFLNQFFNWIKASRIPSQSYIFLPLLLGQSFAFQQNHIWNFNIFILVQIFGLFNQLYIVYANDFADQETDKNNKTFTIFSGGSRVLADGKLTPTLIRNSAVLMAFLCTVGSTFTAIVVQQYILIFFNFLALFLLYAYSYPPIRLSYRGGGEFLQMLGVGLILPLYGFIAQGGIGANFPWSFLFLLLPMNLSCAIATSLPDLPSDDSSEKKTIAVRIGSRLAKFFILCLEIVVYIYFLHCLTNEFHTETNHFYFLIPLIGILFSLFGWKGKPGEFALSVFVFFSIFFTLSIQIILILLIFMR